MLKLLFKSKKIDEHDVALHGIIAGLLESVYVLLVGVMFLLVQSFSSGPAQPGGLVVVLFFASFLTLLVLSVAISGVLVFGLPAYYFLQKKYREGVVAVLATIATVAIFLIFAIFASFFII
ncbi:MAG: hypothetical protein WCP18_04405 [bacterium]